MSAKWIPSDDELDAVARSMSPPSRDAERVEQERTNILAHAAGLAQHPRASRVPFIVAVAAPLAVAAAFLIWFVVRPTEPTPPKETITAIGPAQFERASSWPDFVVRIDDGRLAIEVSALAANETFRATTSDAVIEVRGAKFFVGAKHERVTFVSVREGSAEIRWAQQPVVVVAAGSTWVPQRIAQRETIDLAPPSPSQPAEPTTEPIAAVTSDPAKATPTRRRPKPPSTATTPSEVKPDALVEREPPPKPPIETPPRPGEADFRAGVAALRAGDAAGAAKLFTAACAAAQKDALAEDACFWVGAAAKRAGQTPAAREALTRFLATYPSSARAGEAAALLGWILYDAGELDAAKQRFEVAARDPVPKVKASATKGLEAIKRKQAAE